MLCECPHSYTELDPVLEEERRDSLLTTSLFVPQTGTSIWEEENLVEVRVDHVDHVDLVDQVDQVDQVEEDKEDSQEEVKTN